MRLFGKRRIAIPVIVARRRSADLLGNLPVTTDSHVAETSLAKIQITISAVN
jgi:hypothetical protein